MIFTCIFAAVVAVVFLGAFVENRRKKRRYSRGDIDGRVQSGVFNGHEYQTPAANHLGPSGP